ncbi:MAG: glycerol-3-phosphate 1-O-acyltransferase PlsY [Candidatus Izimaplasma sp.]|nr:glycerol-3-phosphate 1-O-acyltransferase PlsY [Candidatus Izimaplasma bacterium]
MFLKFGLLVIAYFIGAIPFSIILGKKYKGIDVRNHGSGNPGGTNALRFLGRHVGLLVVILDVFKGGIIVLLVNLNVFGADMLHPLAYGVAAALGHVYSIYINFGGGKAVATTVGSMIAFNPLYALIMAVFFFSTLKLTKYVSLASMIGAFSAILIALVFNEYGLPIYDTMLFYVVLFFILIIFRHHTNIKRLLNDDETKTYWL